MKVNAKYAVAFDGATKSVALDGIAPTGGPSAFSIATSPALMLGQSSGASCMNGHIRRLAYFNRRLSNLDMQGLTR